MIESRWGELRRRLLQKESGLRNEREASYGDEGAALEERANGINVALSLMDKIDGASVGGMPTCPNCSATTEYCAHCGARLED